MVVALTPSAADPPTAITVFATGVPSAPVANPAVWVPAGGDRRRHAVRHAKPSSWPVEAGQPWPLRDSPSRSGHDLTTVAPISYGGPVIPQ
jgi:hypothetical protein